MRVTTTEQQVLTAYRQKEPFAKQMIREAFYRWLANKDGQRETPDCVLSVDVNSDEERIILMYRAASTQGKLLFQEYVFPPMKGGKPRELDGYILIRPGTWEQPRIMKKPQEDTNTAEGAQDRRTLDRKVDEHMERNYQQTQEQTHESKINAFGKHGVDTALTPEEAAKLFDFAEVREIRLALEAAEIVEPKTMQALWPLFSEQLINIASAMFMAGKVNAIREMRHEARMKKAQ